MPGPRGERWWRSAILPGGAVAVYARPPRCETAFFAAPQSIVKARSPAPQFSTAKLTPLPPAVKAWIVKPCSGYLRRRRRRDGTRRRVSRGEMGNARSPKESERREEASKDETPAKGLRRRRVLERRDVLAELAEEAAVPLGELTQPRRAARVRAAEVLGRHPLVVTNRRAGAPRDVAHAVARRRTRAHVLAVVDRARRGRRRARRRRALQHTTFGPWVTPP